MSRNLGAWAGALAASTGLVPFAPLLGLTGWCARHGEGFGLALSLATRPVGEWDLVLFGAGMHQWLLLASALPVVALTALGFKNRRFRPIVGGIALGTAALLGQIAFSQDVSYALGSTLLWVWTGANGLVCLWIARIGLGEHRSRRETS
jgi:serine protease